MFQLFFLQSSYARQLKLKFFDSLSDDLILFFDLLFIKEALALFAGLSIGTNSIEGRNKLFVIESRIGSSRDLFHMVLHFYYYLFLLELDLEIRQI